MFLNLRLKTFLEMIWCVCVRVIKSGFMFSLWLFIIDIL